MHCCLKRSREEYGLLAAPNYDLHGNLIGSIGIHLDITNQKIKSNCIYLSLIEKI
jgi:hypothetical protein